MAKKRYDEGTVIRVLTSRISGLKTKTEVIDQNTVKRILLPEGTTMSIDTSGKMDFLTNHCGYSISFYKKEKKENEESSEKKPKKKKFKKSNNKKSKQE